MTIVTLRFLDKVDVTYPEYAKKWLNEFKDYLKGKPICVNSYPIDHFDKQDTLNVFNNLKVKNNHLVYTSEKVEPTILAKVLQMMIKNNFISTIGFETWVYNKPFNIIEKTTVYRKMYTVE